MLHLANRDAVAAVNVERDQFAVKGYFDTRLPGQSYFGAEPVALAVNAIAAAGSMWPIWPATRLR